MKPMPPGYTPTEPLGGWKLPRPPPTSVPSGFHIAPVNTPSPDWWRENAGAIRAVLPPPRPRYIDRTPEAPWIVFMGIVTVAVLIALGITSAVLR